MSTTPQMIKDMEFQTKFRGYDPLEVKSYLENLADEFFEMQERCRLQVDDMQIVHEEKIVLEQSKGVIEAELQEARKMGENLRKAGVISEQRLAVSMQETEGLRSKIGRLEQEKEALTVELQAVKDEMRQMEELFEQEEGEKENLARKIELIHEQQREAKQDEVDFKTTLVVAQQFCDSMREKSQQQAEQLREAVKAEVEQLRRSAHAELSRLPQEIKLLQRQHREAVRTVRHTLESYLHSLEVFPPDEEETIVHDSIEHEDLFQKIKILEDGTLSPEAMAILSDEGYGEDSPSSLAVANTDGDWDGDDAREEVEETSADDDGGGDTPSTR